MKLGVEGPKEAVSRSEGVLPSISKLSTGKSGGLLYFARDNGCGICSGREVDALSLPGRDRVFLSAMSEEESWIGSECCKDIRSVPCRFSGAKVELTLPGKLRSFSAGGEINLSLYRK